MNASSKFKILVSFLFIALLISSCIPSLHPIYTDSTREVDDRLLGTWTARNYSSFSGISYDVKISEEGDTTINLKNMEIDGPSTGPALSDELVEMISTIGVSDEDWKFERAAKISFEKRSSEKISSSISMTVGVPSFAPPGYEVTESEELPFYILTHNEIEDGDTLTSYLLVNMTKIGGEMYLDFVPFPKGDKRRQGSFAANYISGHTFAKVDFDNGKLAINMFDGEKVEDLIKNRRVRLRHEKLGIDGNIVLTASTEELRSFIKKYGSDPELFDDAQLFTQL